MKWTALLLSILLVSCSMPQKKPLPPPTTPNQQRLSITPTPKTWDGPGITHSFAEAAKLVSIAALPDPVEWWHLENRDPKTSKAYLSAQWQNVLLKNNDMTVFIQVGPRSIVTLPGRLFSEPAIRAAYKADVMQRLELYSPVYMNLGIEINALESRADFPDLVSLIRETAVDIRLADSKVMLFVSFQYEGLLEQDGWGIFKKFDFLDAFGISTYPRKKHSSQFGKPLSLPSDYYTQISKVTKKPIIFAELGWSADPAFGGSVQSQQEFLSHFFDNLIRGMNVELVNWWFLYDNVGHGAFFNKMGLIDSDTEKKRPSWNVYKSNSK